MCFASLRKGSLWFSLIEPILTSWVLRLKLSSSLLGFNSAIIGETWFPNPVKKMPNMPCNVVKRVIQAIWWVKIQQAWSISFFSFDTPVQKFKNRDKGNTRDRSRLEWRHKCTCFCMYVNICMCLCTLRMCRGEIPLATKTNRGSRKHFVILQTLAQLSLLALLKLILKMNFINHLCRPN